MKNTEAFKLGIFGGMGMHLGQIILYFITGAFTSCVAQQYSRAADIGAKHGLTENPTSLKGESQRAERGLTGAYAPEIIDNDKVRYRIAVIDTGYDPARAQVPAKLCKTGHYDALTKTANVNFYHPHGTMVVDVLAEKLKDVDYCLIIFQVFTTTPNHSPDATSEDIASALNDTVGLHVTAINASWDGPVPLPLEKKAFENVERVKTPVFVAAGNHHVNLDVDCQSYPTCYGIKNVISVGMQDLESPKEHAKISNYGKLVTIWAPGYYRMGDEENWNQGTSFAAPRALADYILFLEHKRLAALKGRK